MTGSNGRDLRFYMGVRAWPALVRVVPLRVGPTQTSSSPLKEIIDASLAPIDQLAWKRLVRE